MGRAEGTAGHPAPKPQRYTEDAGSGTPEGEALLRIPVRADRNGRRLCERNPALATTVEYARRLAFMVRDRRGEHLALDVWIAAVRLDGQRELRTLANGMRRDHAAIQAALTTTYTSGAVEGNVTASCSHHDQEATTPQLATEPKPEPEPEK
ncbi:transposase [Streptomyces sp. NPDC058534]|uniref:transposase n=1 Tax=Streptomyces sp. NPDC058534 TaxID=3346541 RepID=UPI003661D589